ncbi:hypothetical protein FQN50_004072 [Emmonsiellopsis sp. PD_5]|nr:hypothetical protein FQN50_004072 [Emmonsiellopsis sp. PD_5]
MDLRTIINNDAAGGQRSAAAQPPLSPRQPSAHDLDPLRNGRPRDDVSPAPYPPQHPPEFRAKPPQPPPLQPPLRSPGGSSSYGSAQSPYQHTSASTLSGGPHSASQNLSHGIQTYQSVSRDPYAPNSATSAYNQSAGPLSSPYTPQPMSATTPQSYFSQHRSQSVHSVATPSSAHSYTYPPREPAGAPPQPVPPIQPHAQAFSPTQQRSSLPGTPLGPPPTSFSRPSPHQARPPSSGPDSQQRSLSSPWGGQDLQGREKREAVSPIPQPPVKRHNPGPAGEHQRRYSMETEERSVSVSPKTAVTNPSSSGDNGDLRDQTPQPYRRDVGEPAFKGSISAAHHPGSAHDAGGTVSSQYPPTTPKTSQPPSSSRPSTISPPSKRSLRPELSSSSSTSNMPGQVAPIKEEVHQINKSLQPSGVPKKKRRRYDEPPIYARKAPRTSGNSPMIPSGYNPPSLPSKPTFQRQDSHPDTSVPRNRSLPPRVPQPVAEAVNGETSMNGAVPRSSPFEQTGTSLGPWEPSITGVIPHEEVTKMICDFLFEQVVMRKDIDAGPAGGSAQGSGAVLEVEAKLGRLVDRNRGDRVRIPALTECILSKEDPNIRIGFESSMSLAQHRALNNFLNDAVKASIAQPGTNRIPLTYAHKKERDTFYEIAPSALPPIIQHHLNPRHKPKVRVTTDQRTGAVLARIIKCRIADLDVYSPRTCLDWRISVNLEMNYEGDVGELILPSDPMSPVGTAPGAGRKGGERNKDRMSYRHLAYQIDLTQVAMTEQDSSTPQPDVEHELEIEISSAMVRRQGDLALAGDPKNQYEELVKGFVDNIRVLARAVPPR